MGTMTNKLQVVPRDEWDLSEVPTYIIKEELKKRDKDDTAVTCDIFIVNGFTVDMSRLMITYHGQQYAVTTRMGQILHVMAKVYPKGLTFRQIGDNLNVSVQDVVTYFCYVRKNIPGLITKGGHSRMGSRYWLNLGESDRVPERQPDIGSRKLVGHAAHKNNVRWRICLPCAIGRYDSLLKSKIYRLGQAVSREYRDIVRPR